MKALERNDELKQHCNESVSPVIQLCEGRCKHLDAKQPVVFKVFIKYSQYVNCDKIV